MAFPWKSGSSSVDQSLTAKERDMTLADNIPSIQQHSGPSLSRSRKHKTFSTRLAQSYSGNMIFPMPTEAQANHILCSKLSPTRSFSASWHPCTLAFAPFPSAFQHPFYQSNETRCPCSRLKNTFQASRSPDSFVTHRTPRQEKTCPYETSCQ